MLHTKFSENRPAGSGDEDVMIILVTSKNIEDLMKIEGAGVAITLKIDF